MASAAFGDVKADRGRRAFDLVAERVPGGGGERRNERSEFERDTEDVEALVTTTPRAVAGCMNARDEVAASYPYSYSAVMPRSPEAVRA